MADSPYTQPRKIAYRGPSTSDDYNARLEENGQDLVVLYNRTRLLDTDLNEFYRRLVKEYLAAASLVADLEERVKDLEATASKITFGTDALVDNSKFIGTAYEIPVASQCSVDTAHGIVTLPKVDSSSLSKLFYTNQDNETVIPSALEVRVTSIQPSADSLTATVDTSEPELAILKVPGRIWERNVIVTSPDLTNGAQCTYYVKVPTDLFTTDKSNAVVFHGFPMLGVDLLEVAYTTATSPLLTDADGYTTLNSSAYHASDSNAVGWIAPGGWVGDVAVNIGPRIFYFDPKPVTGLRVKLRRRQTYTEMGKYIYSYGISQLDLRYDKFLTTGKIMVKFEAPTGHTISAVSSVQPEIWNVAEADYPQVFSYRTIWETSSGSGVYVTNPVPLSHRVWVEVTLNQSTALGTPSLSGLSVSFT